MIAPARIAAYDIGCAVSGGRTDLPAALVQIRAGLHDERDRALAGEISTGVQRWRGKLDFLIEHFTRRRLTRLDPEIVEILRLSIYQLLHLTRVPASAVVDDGVQLARRAGKSSAAGLVNAVLRAISRQRSSLPLPAPPGAGGSRDAALSYLTITLSHPRWLAQRWLDRLGFDAAERWMSFNNNPAPLTLRSNPRHGSRTELAARLRAASVETVFGRFAPDALVVTAGNPLRGEASALHEAGAFVVQDEASQLVTLLGGPAPGPLVLDTCASPGGKTTALAVTAEPRGTVVACDVRDRRMALLQRSVAASGMTNVKLVQADLMNPLPFARGFDLVLVDAPCSGLGTLRRDPDIRWRRTETDLEPLASAQRRMLRNAAAVVAPGGRLVYATCSSEPEENEAVAEWLPLEMPEFLPVDAGTTHPDLPATLVNARGRLATTPDQGLEMFFGAVFQRK